jgi:endonuclease-3
VTRNEKRETPMKSSTARRKRGSAPGAKHQTSERARSILQILRNEFPGAATALDFVNPFQLLIATILSAQCTDDRVNKVTPDLFGRYPSAKDLAAADQTELESIIRSTGFYRNKAKNIIACSRAIMERHNGAVPDEMDALVQLPGVGRKTANVLLGQAFGKATGVVVDTHVHRLSRRMGFTTADNPEKIEQDLMNVFAKDDWIDVGSILILHGRRTCDARRPKCAECPVASLCPSAEAMLAHVR